ncbi:hypothetical protein BZA70DRAFT_271309 [Myxozyma melibiosi]|uniref:Shugoshin C-terminal domain-containing protein n=1 Tax=Myxozyma melibiosi TaxID=54550 RepID=A0ABR1FC68_9ASCO
MSDPSRLSPPRRGGRGMAVEELYSIEQRGQRRHQQRGNQSPGQQRVDASVKSPAEDDSGLDELERLSVKTADDLAAGVDARVVLPLQPPPPPLPTASPQRPARHRRTITLPETGTEVTISDSESDSGSDNLRSGALLDDAASSNASYLSRRLSEFGQTVRGLMAQPNGNGLNGGRQMLLPETGMEFMITSSPSPEPVPEPVESVPAGTARTPRPPSRPFPSRPLTPLRQRLSTAIKRTRTFPRRAASKYSSATAPHIAKPRFRRVRLSRFFPCARPSSRATTTIHHSFSHEKNKRDAATSPVSLCAPARERVPVAGRRARSLSPGADANAARTQHSSRHSRSPTSPTSPSNAARSTAITKAPGSPTGRKRGSRRMKAKARASSVMNAIEQAATEALESLTLNQRGKSSSAKMLSEGRAADSLQRVKSSCGVFGNAFSGRRGGETNDDDAEHTNVDEPAQDPTAAAPIRSANDSQKTLVGDKNSSHPSSQVTLTPPTPLPAVAPSSSATASPVAKKTTKMRASVGQLRPVRVLSKRGRRRSF